MLRLSRYLAPFAFVLALVVPTPGEYAGEAYAELYKYRDANGEIVVTTEPRSDLELVEIIGEAKSRTSSKRASSKATPKHRARTRAKISADQNAFDHIIREASEAYDIPFAFIKAVIKVESNFNTHAVSHVGAMGLMQLMPGTAEDMGVTDAFDARQNIFGGTRYLRKQANRYNGDINLVLAAYNAGPGNVDKYGGIPFEKTRGYVKNVYRWYQSFLQHEDQSVDDVELDEP